MNPNLSLIENPRIIHQKITILTSTVRKRGDHYYIENEFEEIVKDNYGEKTSCVIRTNYEDFIVSNDLKEENNRLYYDCDNILHATRCRIGNASEEKKLTEDIPKLYEYVNNARCRISKRIFGKEDEYLQN